MRTIIPPMFYVSYNLQDQDWARWVAWQINESGYEVHLPPCGAYLSPAFREHAYAVADRAHRVVVLLSPAYLRDADQHIEWAIALSREPAIKGCAYVPMRIAPCQPDRTLFGDRLLDLCGLTERQAETAITQMAYFHDERHPRLPPLGQRHRAVPVRPPFPGQPRLRSLPLAGPGDGAPAAGLLPNLRLAQALAQVLPPHTP